VKQRYEVIVVGGGMTGLTVAALLAQGRAAEALRITVIDAASRLRFDPDDDVALRVSAIAAGSTEILGAVGAWEAVAATRACPYEHMRVWDGDDDPDGPSTLRFDADEFGVAQLGFIAENALVQDALLRVLDRTDVNLRFDTPIRSLEVAGDRYRVHLEDGRELDADLLVGADGARSFVRESAGIDVTRRPYAQTAFVTHLKPEEAHGATARQRFLAEGPLGMLPLADGRISVVWSTTPGTARRAMQAGDDELGALLTEASDQVLGDLTAAGPRGTFPLCAQHAKNYVLPRLALIGDAAHAVHPLAGQGANLGLADAGALSTVIEEAIRKGEHPGDRPVLRRYERARKGANATMLHLMTGLNQLFAAGSPTIGEIRRAGMRLFNVSGPLRERAVRVALGAGRR
jgi:2-octaprenylphenol hydroxylase